MHQIPVLESQSNILGHMQTMSHKIQQISILKRARMIAIKYVYDSRLADRVYLPSSRFHFHSTKVDNLRFK